MADTVTLGNFTFDVDDLFESHQLGGELMMAVKKFPGGNKEVQTFGFQLTNPTWSGQFNYSNALDKYREVYKMFTAGSPVVLQVGADLNTRYVIIKRFEGQYRSSSCIPYTIELEILTQPQSLLIPNNTANPNGTTDTTQNISSPPDSNNTQQKTYTVQDGDTLWSISCKFYNGDGSQYRKIATANNIQNPDIITIGETLVIP